MKEISEVLEKIIRLTPNGKKSKKKIIKMKYIDEMKRLSKSEIGRRKKRVEIKESGKRRGKKSSEETGRHGTFLVGPDLFFSVSNGPASSM